MTTRYRLSRRRPGLAVLVVLTLAVGAGVSGAVFSVVAGTALQSLPFESSDRLVLVGARNTRTRTLSVELPVQDYGRLRRESQSFEDLAAYGSFFSFVTAEGGGTRTYAASQVTSGLFRLLGVVPRFGRGFSPDDELPSAPPVVLLGDKAWEELFGGNPGIVGRTVLVNGQPREVIGVMPQGFSFPESQQVWMNLQTDPSSGQPIEEGTVSVLGLVEKNISLKEAGAEVSRFAGLALEQQCGCGDSFVIAVESFAAAHTDPALRRAFLPMVIALAGLLVLVSANSANLLLFRALQEDRAYAVRLALGASKKRLLLEAAGDALLLSAAAMAIGLPLGGLLIEAFNLVTAPADFLRGFWVDIRLSPVVALAIALVAITTCLVAEILPVLRLAAANPRSLLADGGRSQSGLRANRTSRYLVVAQVALAVGLLVASGLLLQAIARLRDQEIHFDATRILVGKLSIAQRTDMPPSEILQFFDGVSREIEGIPGVRQVAFGSLAPTQGASWSGVEVEGHDGALRSSWIVASKGWFSTLGLGLVAGREFSAQDNQDSPPVAVVSRTFAERSFKLSDPLGRRIRRLESQGTSSPWATVVGVVPDVPLGGIRDQEKPATVYFPHAQVPRSSMAIAVSTSQSVSGVIPQLAERIAAVDRFAAIFDTRSLEDILKRRRWAFDSIAILFSGLAVLALILASIGTYAVVSVASKQRLPEIGLRLALGADRGDVRALVVSMGFRQVVAGVAIGVVLAATMGRYLSSISFGVSPWDPRVYGVVAVVVLCIGVLAAWLPAERASRTDPASALK